MARPLPFALLFGFAAALLTPNLAEAACGAENKKPCPVWKGRASCDKGLVEDFSKNRCVRKSKPKPIFKAKPKTRPSSCGRQGQRPCKVVEFVPSCVKGLSENFATGKCVAPGRPKTCGSKGQRPCKVVEAFPSCKKGLAEDFAKNKCVTPRPIKVPSCEAAVKLVKGHGKKAAGDARSDTDAFRDYLKRNPEAEAALEQAVARLKRKHAKDIAELSRVAAKLNQSKRNGLQRKMSEEKLICRGARKTMREVEQLGQKIMKDKLSKGAITLSGVAEANAIAGVAASSGLVFAYDTKGQQRFGAQVSVQGQAVTDIDVAAGVQLGWWPGAKLTHSRADWTLDPREVVGAPHDGLLSGPYVSVHAGAGPEALAEIEIAIDLIFEVPDLTRKVDVDWFLDHFAGITLTVTAGASAVPAQFSVGAAIGNTFTVALPPLK